MDKVLISFQAYQSADLRFIDRLIRSLFEPPEGIQLGYNATQTSVIDIGLAITAEEFLKTEFDYLLSLDYDILVNPFSDPNYKFGSDIKRIVESAKETGGLVGAPYLIRGRDDLCGVPLKTENLIIGPGGKLTEMLWIPTGFTCISREILETMAESLPLVEYDGKVQIHPFFLPFIWDAPDGKKVYLSLDFAFSQRCRDLGFKVYLDTRIVLGHLGQKIFVPMPEAKCR
jgi:hypothetical protein